MAIAEEVFWSPSSTFYWFLTFVFFFTAVLWPSLQTLVSSSQHSASHKQLHLCSKTKTQTQTKTKTGQYTRKTLQEKDGGNQFYISMFCFVINFRIVKQIEGVIVFPHCETQQTKKTTIQPTNPFHFMNGFA
jgi:hypothetical protein